MHGADEAFNYDMQQGFFEMTIKSSTYDLRLIAPRVCDACDGGYEIVTNTVPNLHRNYTGAFNYISMGAGMGCELDPADTSNGKGVWDCKVGSARTTDPWAWFADTQAFVDRAVVYGGESDTGACCDRTTLSCTDDVQPGDCQSPAKGYHGGQTCDELLAELKPCCHYPLGIFT